MSYAAASCAFTVEPGKPHPRYPGGKYKVCITPNQNEKLFGSKTTQPPEPIGCGVFACAYPGPDAGKIVKITRDGSDIAGLSQAQGSPFVPKLFGAYRLASFARWTSPERQPVYSYSYVPNARRRPELRAYGAVVERLRPLPPKFKRWINNMGYLINARTAARMGFGVDELARACPKKKDRFACLRGAVKLMRVYEGLREYGIDLGDLHYGNIGADSKGNWKIIDLGQSPGTGGSPDVDELAGRRRRRR